MREFQRALHCDLTARPHVLVDDILRAVKKCKDIRAGLELIRARERKSSRDFPRFRRRTEENFPPFPRALVRER